VTDSDVLREAAAILRFHTKRPGNFWLGVLCKILTDQADKLEGATRR
jgi:hypothetical protein